jgi:hypothetical protein
MYRFRWYRSKNFTERNPFVENEVPRWSGISHICIRDGLLIMLMPVMHVNDDVIHINHFV